MTWWIFLLLLVLFIATIILAYIYGRTQRKALVETDTLPPNLLALYQEIQKLPSRVLSTIQGSINPKKGKVAELLTYAELRYDYDVIIPLGQPIDFIGIKEGQRIDFIEVKSGSAVLSPEQEEIRRMIQGGLVRFRLINLNDDALQPFLDRGDIIVR
ncbi:MAG: Holliday junction resolvase-like protein [bacterium]|nr:Holliday junction resolvase-like protein [bacterium]